MARVVLKNLSKRYAEVEAVRSVSFEIGEGHLVALLGPSGCGKTSTLKMIAGLEEITSGELYFDEHLMNRVDPEGRDVAMVFEDYSLYPRMSVVQNIEFPLKIRGISRSERTRHVSEMLELLELGDVAAANVRELSGGQQQRVAIARALVREPAVLLLDEPLSHLDAELKVRLREQIRYLQQKKNVTTVLVTHDQAEAVGLADEIVVMFGGDLHQYGTPEQTYREPHDFFVAGFIGEPPMNFLDCELTIKSDVVVVRSDGLSVELTPERSRVLLASDISTSETYKLGIRPEDLEIVPTGKGSANAFGNVFFSEWRGEHQVVMVSQGSDRRHWLSILMDPSTTLRTGDEVGIRCDPNEVYLFDAHTRLNLLADAGAQTNAREETAGMRDSASA